MALILDAPAAFEVQGLRRALGDRSLGRIAPHLTLVPPVNVRSEGLGDALAVLRKAASGQAGALELDLGPAGTFVPVNPVVFLDVSGPGLEALARLHRAVSAGPLLRAERWPWRPHVTLCDEAPVERAVAAAAVLAEYRAAVSFDRLVMLEEGDRRWRPLADASLGPAAVVGRGGLELEITEGRLLGPDGRAMFERQPEGAAALGTMPAGGGIAVPPVAGVTGGQGVHQVVLTGRRDGGVVGVAAAWAEAWPGGRAHVLVLVDTQCRRQGTGRALLVGLEASLRRRGWAMERVQGHGPAAFFASCCAWGSDFEAAG
ncbi:MAG: 2'-5' RNA ligase family protein [Acidimicrobiales bacterium]